MANAKTLSLLDEITLKGKVNKSNYFTNLKVSWSHSSIWLQSPTEQIQWSVSIKHNSYKDILNLFKYSPQPLGHMLGTLGKN